MDSQIMAWAMIVAPVLLYLLWEGYGIYQDTRPNRMKAVFINDARQIKVIRVTVGEDGKTFSVAGKIETKYHVQEQCIYRGGMFRVPTSYYVVGQADPINIKSVSSESSQTAEAFHEATEAHVARDIIKSFEQPLVTITTSMIITLAVVVIANAYIFIQLKQQLDSIQNVLGVGGE